jgi:AcrR family transcriptional regulator
MSAESPSLSPRAARTRAALLRAGLDLLSERPVDAIAIDELVAAAGVAKGSFFNHFEDKQKFAEAISAEIRAAIEFEVTSANRAVADPLERLAGGMIVAARFALGQPKRASVLIRNGRVLLSLDHPLNKGVRADMSACRKAGMVQPIADRIGVLYWLGCCLALMGALVETKATRAEATNLLSDMLLVGLNGLGAPKEAAQRIADRRRIRAMLDRPIEGAPPGP